MPDIVRFSHGIDTAPVRELRAPAPAVREEIALREQTNDDGSVRCALFRLAVRAGMKMRKMGLAAGRMSLALTYADGSRVRRTARLRMPLNGDLGLFGRGMEMLRSLHCRRIRVGGLALHLTDLTAPYGQIGLFEEAGREDELMGALDAVRERYGDEAIGFYGKLHGEEGR